MSNWASITSADFAIGAYFHQPTVTDVHPALRQPNEPSEQSRSSVAETVGASSTASECGSYDGPETPATIGDLSNLQIEGGADKVPLPTDIEGLGLIPLYEEPSNPQSSQYHLHKPSLQRSPPKARYMLFPPQESEKTWARPPMPQRMPSDTSSHTSYSDSQEPSARKNYEFRFNPHARSMSHDGQWNIQPDNSYAFSRAQATPSPPPPGYFTPAPGTHAEHVTSHPSSLSPKFHGAEWEGSLRKTKNRSMSLPVSSFKKFLKKGSTPLVEAAKVGDYNELLRLLAPGPQNHPISAPDRDGFTPLHHASRLGYAEIARALVLRRAELEARTKSQDRTPLWFAVHAGHSEIVEMLIENKANPNAVSKMDGATPLHKASQQGNEEVMQLLIKGGADVNLRDVEGMPPLMWATQSKRMSAARLLIEQGASLETRIKLGANLELASQQGLTVLQKAVNVSDHALAQLFLDMGANPNCWGPNGLKPLHKAASRGDDKMCSLLLEAGAEVGTRTPDGWTALHFAARHGHEEVADLLIKKGCEPLVVNANGETAKHVAEKYGYHNIV